MNNLLRDFVRYRVLLLDGLETLLVLLIALGLNLTADNQTAIVAVAIGLIGLAKGILTDPFPVTVLTDLTRAVVVLFAGFNFNLPADRLALAATAIGTFIALIQTGQVSPTTTSAAGGARRVAP